MKKWIKISTPIIVCIVPMVTLFTVAINKKNEPHYTFDLHDIIDGSRGKADVSEYFSQHYGRETITPTNDELCNWSIDEKTTIEHLVKNMSNEQLSYDIAYFISNWWNNLYNSYDNGNGVPWIAFLPSYAIPGNTSAGYNKEWFKDWKFNVDASKEVLKNGSLICSFNIDFQCFSVQQELNWADAKDINQVRSASRVSVNNAFIDFENYPTNDLYRINTRSLTLSPDSIGSGWMSVFAKSSVSDIWDNEGYANLGGSAMGYYPFSFNSFILSRFINQVSAL